MQPELTADRADRAGRERRAHTLLVDEFFDASTHGPDHEVSDNRWRDKPTATVAEMLAELIGMDSGIAGEMLALLNSRCDSATRRLRTATLRHAIAERYAEIQMDVLRAYGAFE